MCVSELFEGGRKIFAIYLNCLLVAFQKYMQALGLGVLFCCSSHRTQHIIIIITFLRASAVVGVKK
jgi:hypothetical protein